MKKAPMRQKLGMMMYTNQKLDKKVVTIKRSMDDLSKILGGKAK